MAQQTVVLLIDELDCAEEVQQLRRGLGNCPGVVQLDFDVLNHRMQVVIDEQLVSPADLVRQIADMGMHARFWHGQSKAEPASVWRQQIRLALTALSGLLLILGFGAHAVWSGSLLDAVGARLETGGSTVPAAARALYGASILVGVWFVARKAWAALRYLRPDMNLLMCVAVAGAMLLGQWLEAAMVTFLFSVALLLEHWSVDRARRAIASLLDLSPATARCLTGPGNVVQEKPVAEVRVGERVVVRPGEKFPLDGVVVRGNSYVNQAPITGESLPVVRHPGDSVYAGTINGEGAIEFHVSRPADDTTLARIIHMVQQAHARRAPTEQWVETFARYYTPAMFGLALLIAFVPPLVVGADWSAWIYNALVVLVIACPCALVISTPVTIVSALTAAARHGVLIKGGRYLEAAAHLRGGLRQNRNADAWPAGRAAGDPPQRPHAGGTARTGRGPGVAQHASDRSGHTPLRSRRGRAERRRRRVPDLARAGAEAVFQGRRYWIGSHRLMVERLPEARDVHAQSAQLEDAGHSVIAVGTEDHVCGLISVADRVRDEAAAAIRTLRQLGVQRIWMLTGDSRETARGIAEQVGIDDFLAEMLPQDKVQQIDRFAAGTGRWPWSEMASTTRLRWPPRPSVSRWGPSARTPRSKRPTWHSWRTTSSNCPG